MADTQVPNSGPHDPNQLAALTEAIHKHLLDTLNQPQPQAPQVPIQQPLGGVQAAAAALNPQFAPLLMQQANAPAQAQYQQQQAAFEAAMQGQQHALAAGTQLLGQGSKEDIAQMMEQGRQGQNDISNQLRMLGLLIQARNSDTAANKPTPETNWQVVGPDQNQDLWQVNPKTGEKRLIGLKKPSPQDKQMDTGMQAVQDTIDEMRGLYTTAVGQHGAAERNTQEVLQGIPVVRNFAGMLDPMAQQHEALRNKLVLQLNKPVSGQSRLLQSEITQLLKYVPAYGTDPSVAIPQFDSMQRMIDQMKSKYATSGVAARPSGQPAAVKPSLDSEFDSYLKTRGRSAPKP